MVISFNQQDPPFPLWNPLSLFSHPLSFPHSFNFSAPLPFCFMINTRSFKQEQHTTAFYLASEFNKKKMQRMESRRVSFSLDISEKPMAPLRTAIEARPKAKTRGRYNQEQISNEDRSNSSSSIRLFQYLSSLFPIETPIIQRPSLLCINQYAGRQ